MQGYKLIDMDQRQSRAGSRKVVFNVGEQYEIQDVVGEGAYGVVCSAMHAPSGQKVAIKKITPFDHTVRIPALRWLGCFRHVDHVI